jgi:hypothetical protein
MIRAYGEHQGNSSVFSKEEELALVLVGVQ